MTIIDDIILALEKFSPHFTFRLAIKEETNELTIIDNIALEKCSPYFTFRVLRPSLLV